MSTWARNGAELLAFLTGFDQRDALSKRRRFPVAASAQASVPPRRQNSQLTAQNDTLALVYGVMRELRKWLQDGSGDAPPTAADLLKIPQVGHPLCEGERGDGRYR